MNDDEFREALRRRLPPRIEIEEVQPAWSVTVKNENGEVAFLESLSKYRLLKFVENMQWGKGDF